MRKPSTIKIGKIIQQIRKSNGYTQEKLAEQIFSEYISIRDNKTLEYQLSGYDKLSDDDKKTIEYLIMYFNNSK